MVRLRFKTLGGAVLKSVSGLDVLILNWLLPQKG